MSIILADDEFVVDSGSHPDHPHFSIGRPTGRTAKTWSIDCPTVERFDIDTVVKTDYRIGETVYPTVIMGARGARIAGTLAYRPR